MAATNPSTDWGAPAGSGPEARFGKLQPASVTKATRHNSPAAAEPSNAAVTLLAAASKPRCAMAGGKIKRASDTVRTTPPT
jgi:hypothetical protein